MRSTTIRPGTRIGGGYVIVRKPRRGGWLVNLILAALACAAGYGVIHSAPPASATTSGTVTDASHYRDAHGWHWQLTVRPTTTGASPVTFPVPDATALRCHVHAAYPACAGH